MWHNQFGSVISVLLLQRGEVTFVPQKVFVSGNGLTDAEIGKDILIGRSMNAFSNLPPKELPLDSEQPRKCSQKKVPRIWCNVSGKFQDHTRSGNSFSAVAKITVKF